MKYFNGLFFLSLLISSTSSQATKPAKDDLLRFSEANCFFWYFKENDIDTSEIRKITAGIVSKSTYASDKFSKAAILAKEFSPQVASTSNIDISLSKCFLLESDQAFLKRLAVIHHSD